MSSRIPLQTLPPHGPAQVEARRWPWMIRGRIAHGDVGRLHVVPLAADAPDLDTLLVPFDEVGQPRMRPRPRAVSRHWLRRWVAGWPATAWPAIPVASGIDCPISLLPYQCAPVQAVVEGAGARVMLADRVGAGKTVEAGLIVAELAARQAADRVLVLVPSSLGDQWRDELASRCRVVLTLVDRAAFAARQRQTPPGLGPFDAPARLVMSIDLAKQPDVLAHLAATTWDVLVVDEAHTACGDSARMAAAQAIGRRARVVVLATATPHAGDDEAFARLCRIGDLGEGPLLWFRHDAAADGRPGSSRVRDVRARRSPAEREAHALLQRYVRRLDAAGAPSARLAAAVLRKRALSSPAALWRSLRHRAEWLADRREGLCQTLLPFDDQEQDHADAAQPVALCGPGFADAHAERRLLQPALDAARRAAGDWGKARAIARLLARTREPALIFTEYRDTLDAVVEAIAGRGEHVALHGGLDRAARRAALERFLSGAARVLVATDIAAEGLNLQQRCRLVVHVELPWSPARLEQRAGRVDRMGQRRRVHVWRLLGEPAHEARLVAALSARVARLRAAGFDVAPAAAFATAEGSAPGPGAAVGQERAGRADRLCADSVRIRRLLHRCRRPGAPAGATNRGHLAWRRARNPGGLPRGVLVVCLTQPAVRGVRAALVPVHVELSAWPAGSPSVWLPALARRAAAAVAAERALPAALSERERRLLAAAEAEQARVAGRWQASLFERRAARVVAAAREAAAMQVAEHRRRLNELDPGVEPPAIPVVALLVD
jgi:superfamily II DNA or RNA helicase